MYTPGTRVHTPEYPLYTPIFPPTTVGFGLLPRALLVTRVYLIRTPEEECPEPTLDR